MLKTSEFALGVMLWVNMGIINCVFQTVVQALHCHLYILPKSELFKTIYNLAAHKKLN